MTRKTRVLSMILAVLMTVSMLSAFSVSFAINPQAAAEKAAADINMFSFSSFEAIDNPGYGADVKATNIVFVEDDWEGAENNTYVYMKFGDLVYKAIMGENAFSSIADAVLLKGRENLVVKVGPGTYSDAISAVCYNGLKFYGNYANVEPNVDGADMYTKELNPLRDPDKESVITAKWQWSKNCFNVTVDGFTVSGAGQFSMANSSAYAGDIYIYRNIFTGATVVPMIANAGYTNTFYVKNNRFVKLTKNATQLGGANSDVQFENNYYENCSDSAFYINATGNSTGSEALISFAGNIFNSCKNPIRLDYVNANYGSNLCFNRITDNLFYNCSGDYTIYIKMWPDYYKSGTSATTLYDPKSKTFITGNTFAEISSTTPVISLDGQESISGNDANFIVSVIENKFLFKSPSAEGNTAIMADITGTIDASYNYYNSNSKTTIFSIDNELIKSIVTMPYYNDSAMKELAGVGSLSWQERTMGENFKTDAGSFGVDNKKFQVYGAVKDGKQNVTVDNKSLVAANADYQLYYDFNLSRPVFENTVNLAGDRTTLYIVVTDKTTGQSSKYGLVLTSKSDKTKAELIDIYETETDMSYANYRVSADKKTYYISLADDAMYFPFYVVASPSAKVTYYTDAACKTVYSDSKYYMKPDDTTVIYAKITSGDGKKTNVYTLEFKRQGSDDVDAQIIKSITPVEDIVIFNNERKSIVYRPFVMTRTVEFDFEVSQGATYAIYTDVLCTNLVSKQGDVKTIELGDAITYYYVKVTNAHGYEVVYSLVCYNDVRSTDNIITGVTGITDGITIKDNIITIEASPTLSLINAHFETNAFADIKVYPDVHKTYSVEPSITMATVNNREVEVPTFQLGISNKVSYFFVDVTSEMGQTNSYKVVIFKRTSTVKFSDISGHWAEDYILDSANLGLVSGYNEGGKKLFKPDNNASRQEVAVLLCRMLGIEPLAFKNVSLGSVFSDASDIPEWSYDYIKGAYALGFMVGSNGSFNGEAKITRQEFFRAIATVLHLDTAAAASVDLSKFSDASKVSSWAVAATKACVKAGIVEGDGNKLNPTANITRAEISTILSKCTTIRNDVRYA